MKTRLGTRAALATVGMGMTVTAFGLGGCGDNDDESASVAFSAPADGATLSGGVVVGMTADGITIEKAGEAHDGAGHFHVIADGGCIASGAAVPRDADHVHFGAGQSEGTIYLEPGPHELCLQAGDGTHVALDATDTVEITVGIDSLDEWCATIGEVDELFSVTDGSGDDLAVRQVGYENIRRLLEQLEDGIAVVDESARADMLATLGFASKITGAFIDAKDDAETQAALDVIFADIDSGTEPGVAWVASRCGVDIDG
jgi:hypothetical protein